MDLNLIGRNALVCGGSQGIGKAIAIELALLGAGITLVARNDNSLKAAVADLDMSKGQMHNYFTADFNDPEKVKNTLELYLKEQQPQILINNTGGPAAGLLSDAQTEDLIKAYKQHIVCNQILAQALVPYMKKAKFGRIINVISTSVKEPIYGLGVSNTIRGAVASWAKTLATELAMFGITVNNVLPGYTKTPRLNALLGGKAKSSGKTEEMIEKEMISEIPVGRFGHPGEIAAAAAFLASPAAAYITGTSILVDGGRTKAL